MEEKAVFAVDKPAPPPSTLGSFMGLGLTSPPPVSRGVKTLAQAKQDQTKSESLEGVTLVKPFGPGEEMKN